MECESEWNRCLPPVGLGTWVERDSPEFDEEKMLEGVEYALTNGYRLLDCSQYYPLEKQIGQLFQRLVGEGRVVRENLWLMGKGRPDSIDVTLEDFGVEYLDVYLWHHPPTRNFQELWRGWLTLAEQVKVGKVRHVGLSNLYAPVLERLVERCIQEGVELPFALEIEIHYWCHERELVEYLHAHRIVPVAYSPLGYMYHDTVSSHDTLVRISDEVGCNPHQLALAWNIRRGVVVIPKSSNPEHLRMNLVAEEIADHLTDSQFQELEKGSNQGINIIECAANAKEECQME